MAAVASAFGGGRVTRRGAWIDPARQERSPAGERDATTSSFARERFDHGPSRKRSLRAALTSLDWSSGEAACGLPGLSAGSGARPDVHRRLCGRCDRLQSQRRPSPRPSCRPRDAMTCRRSSTSRAGERSLAAPRCRAAPSRRRETIHFVHIQQRAPARRLRSQTASERTIARGLSFRCRHLPPFAISGCRVPGDQETSDASSRQL